MNDGLKAAVERLQKRVDGWKLNGPQTWVNIRLGDLRLVLAALQAPCLGKEELREKVARIISPSAFEPDGPWRTQLGKSSAIIGLLSAQPAPDPKHFECFQCGHDLLGPICPACNPEIASGGWQPIETAPRDGTLIWTYDTKRSPESAMRVCWWTSFYRDEEGWVDDDDSEPEPTHWKPLPLSPASSGGASLPDSQTSGGE